eukprot:5449570-Pleurochrysis_carterae.AAC.1
MYDRERGNGRARERQRRGCGCVLWVCVCVCASQADVGGPLLRRDDAREASHGGARPLSLSHVRRSLPLSPTIAHLSLSPFFSHMFQFPPLLPALFLSHKLRSACEQETGSVSTSLPRVQILLQRTPSAISYESSRSRGVIRRRKHRRI